MTRNRFWQQVGVELRELLGWEAAQASAEEEFNQLFRDLRQHTAVLARARAQLHARRQQVAQQEQEATLLTQRVQVYLQLGDQDKAWHLALELESLRQALDAQREQMGTERQTCQTYRCYVEQIKRRLADVRAQDYAKP